MARIKSRGYSDIFLAVAFTVITVFSLAAFSPGITLAALINKMGRLDLDILVLWIINLVFTFMLCLALYFKSGWYFYKLYFKINAVVFVLAALYSIIFKDPFIYNVLRKMYSVYFRI